MANGVKSGGTRLLHRNRTIAERTSPEGMALEPVYPVGKPTFGQESVPFPGRTQTSKYSKCTSFGL